MTSKTPSYDGIVRSAEKIMSADREVLLALASTGSSKQLATAREIMKRRRIALNKLAK